MEWSAVDESIFITLLHFCLPWIDIEDNHGVAETLESMAASMSRVRRRRFRTIHMVMKLDEIRARLWSFHLFLQQPGIEYIPARNIVNASDEYLSRWTAEPSLEAQSWRNFRERGLPNFIALREIIDDGRLGYAAFDWLYNYASE